ncbi:3-oxoacyl-ACP synthase [Pilimelia anulata]|uniref:3-oxoacyl-ACP synthase n=1 Tax=Pilimelia anulata TaxID=53371 RepID=A0A8J3FBQ6_9ACTN|nr:ketoacyl-ACP synthase III [Pilimelia anulata]GGK02641.1 3-oxoacyl-ACP synthase [Pilimelia anulata]
MITVPDRVAVTAAAAYLPERVLSDADVVARIDGSAPLAGTIARATGVTGRHVAAPDQQASDLAVAAATKLLADRGLAPADLDLLIFASASQDLIEPATAHITAHKLGARCPVFDLKNACNSWLNGVEVAAALVGDGRYRRVLVCTGEVPSRTVSWTVPDRAAFTAQCAAFTLSDAGGAALVEPVAGGGIRYRAFAADSTAWDRATIRAGGTMHGLDPAYAHFRGDGRALKEACERLAYAAFTEALARTDTRWDDYAAICVHVAAVPHLYEMCERAGIPTDRLVPTLAGHGNTASATLPLQLSLALDRGQCGPGDRVALIGLASGISLGIMLQELP